ncbi:helix-turn-helix transcriptional regulator [Pseudomonas fuscovaginae UPB0736]|uniref:AraC family transcriptional regulator n=1 Tax=Pseudomonas asplenii TaxID=53407 RepID=UPI00028A23E5|nr:helix-turn-helix transcriptional regulator [Pseudomonas fuscovaginae]UUQ64335.1 helix-turn-helix transcriptional regulator [Pseudomonas fuscovaginae UPB0736]
MSSPLVAPELITRLAARQILAVCQRSDAVRETPMHRHPQGQLLGSAEGLIAVVTSAQRFVIPATHAIWLPPNCEHALRSFGGFSGWSVYVALEGCAELPLQPKIIQSNPVLSALIDRATCWTGSVRSGPEQRLASVILDEISSSPEEPLGLPMPQDPRLLRIANALLDDLSSLSGQRSWADWGNMSTRTFARKFAAETGFSFTSWRQRARALRAIEQLTHGEPVTKVALDLGYENVSAFIAMFKRVLGVTPGRYVEGTIRKRLVAGQ